MKLVPCILLTACVSVMPVFFGDHNGYQSQTPESMSHSTAGVRVIVDAGQKWYIVPSTPNTFLSISTNSTSRPITGLANLHLSYKLK